MQVRVSCIIVDLKNEEKIFREKKKTNLDYKILIKRLIAMY